jgi:hypothetical protein
VVRVTGMVVKIVGVEFFCYYRDRPGSLVLRDELLEEHWSYMDRYEAEMIARGPTLAGGRPPKSLTMMAESHWLVSFVGFHPGPRRSWSDSLAASAPSWSRPAFRWAPAKSTRLLAIAAFHRRSPERL